MKIFDKNEEWTEEEEKELEEEEKGKKHPPLSVRVIKILFLYFAIGFLGWHFFNFIFSSNFCNVKEVVIKGNDYLNEDEIFSNSGIKLGENIFKLDLIKSINFLKQEPWIKEVEIKRVIPNKIIISLMERTAAAIVRSGEEYFFSTKDGLVLSKMDKPEGEFVLPLLLGLEISKIKIGEMINKSEFRTALESINSIEVILPKMFCRVEILSSDDFMICNKDDTLKVRVSRPELVINKENLLREALGKIEREKLLVEYMDIRFKDSLLIKLKK